MSRDNHVENSQEATVRVASSIFNYGMFCANRCMEEYTNALKLYAHFSKSYSEIFYGSGLEAERLFANPTMGIEAAPDTEAYKVVIPIPEIKEVTYDKAPEGGSPNVFEQLVKKN